MIRNIVSLIACTTFAVAVQAAPSRTPAPAAESASAETGTRAGNRKVSAKKSKRARSKPLLKITPAVPLPLGWSIQNGEWVHSDGYKYVNGQLIRTGSHTHKTPPRPPSKAQLNAAAAAGNRPAPTPPPNSAAAKAEEIARNKRPRPAPQTGSNL